MRVRFWSAALGFFLVSSGLLVADLSVGPATAAGTKAFKTPSGNIICEGWGNADGSGEVVCVIKTGLKLPEAKHDCSGGGDPIWNRVSLSPTGLAEPVPRGGDPGPFAVEARARVLANNSTWVQGRIACASFGFGLVCTNSSGHGFFLSRTQTRLF
jgi:hypothetical protein